jgi:hypothetical protein
MSPSIAKRLSTWAALRRACCGSGAPAHTKGDELTLVEPDHTLVSGDVVQNRTMPFIFGDGGTPTSWHDVLDKIAALNVLHVVPDHSPPGDGSLVAAERELISSIRLQAFALKPEGVAVDAAGRQVSADLKKQHPDWPDTNVSGIVKSVYADTAEP